MVLKVWRQSEGFGWAIVSPNKMIDTHAHLSGRFCGDLKEAVGLIEKSKLETVVLAAASVEESEENIVLAKKYEKLVAAVGIHPQKVDVGNKESIDKQLGQLDELISKQREWVKSVGESGLDFSKAPEGEETEAKKTR